MRKERILESVPAAPQNRISVIRDSEVVPLIQTTRPASPAQAQPWQGILLEKHAVQATEIPEHQHGEFCLHLQLTGNSEFEWWCEGKNRVEQTRPGSIILLAPGTRDRLRWTGPSERLILAIQPDLLTGVAEEYGGSGAEFPNQWALQDPGLQQLVMEMGREQEAGWPLGGLYADLLGTQLAGLLLRRHAASPILPPPVRGGLPMHKLRSALEFINDHLQDDLRLDQMASEAGLSPFHFARMFQASLGQSPHQYLLDQRIARAKHLLRESRFSIQEIALASGWNSPVNFTRAFRQRTGMTPGAWRSGQ